eukprot:TRINITY_DN1374_c0_g1_i3.p1 TRINITY_DN1374_c0_g1~~TRINITY_DN1374_c0_g1_i3.p1  ORF type:complete len:484 (-),score=87.13 TRINITY_DN1374_c0_g1_i3:327-1709(-)
MASTTHAEAREAAVTPNGPMPQTTPWLQQQPCVVAMVVPAEHFLSGLPGGAMLLPGQQFQCEQLQAAVQPQMHGPIKFLHMPRDWTIQSQPFYIADSYSCGENFWMTDDAADSTTQGSHSEADQSNDSQDWEPSPRWPQLTNSAARRLRRKRVADRFTKQLTTMEACPSYGQDLLTGGPCSDPPAPCLDAEMLSDLQLKLSEDGRKGVEDALAAIRGQVWSLAGDPKGCRVVQLALERASQQEASELVIELHGHVQEAATSPHANYVIQKVVSQLTFSAASFVAEELAGSCARLARHRFGCRIFCRLLEFFSTQSSTLQLVEELLGETQELCCHSFAHHVMQAVIENGNQRHCKLVVAALLTNPLAFAQDKNASYLVKFAFRYSCQEDNRVLLAQLSHPDAIAALAISQYGCHVVRALMEVEELDTQAVLHIIRQIMPQLRETKRGQRLLVDLGLETDSF